MKILITGGTGRIGANLAKALLAKGHEIRSFVYPGDASRAHKLDGFDGVETVVGDLRNFDDVKRAVQGVDAIYHLAAAFGGPFDNRQYLEINGMGAPLTCWKRCVNWRRIYSALSTPAPRRSTGV